MKCYNLIMLEKKINQKFLENSKEILRLRHRVIFISLFLSLVTCIALQATGAIESLEDRIGRPALFYIRQQLGLAPKLDPRVVIYAYSDDAVNEWGRPELLSGKQWGEILGAIAAHKPKAIFVDMIFGNKRKDPSDVAAMNRAFKQPSPIFTAAVVFQNPLKRAKPLDMTHKEFVARGEDLKFLQKYQGGSPTKTPYGPAANLSELHRRVGQINFRVPGFFMPVVPFPPDRMLKHMSLANPDISTLTIESSDVFVNGNQLFLNRDGESVVNYSSPKDYFKNTYEILDLVEMRRAGNFSNLIKNDSIVLFLPLMFTGNADFKQTFVGQLAGGYVHASILNSSLTGNWIHVFDPAYLGVFCAVLAGFFGALIRRNYMMISYAAAMNVIFFTACVVSFFAKGWLVEWLNCILAFNLMIIPVLIWLEVSEEIHSIRITDALSGVLSPKMLEQINKAPDMFSLSAVEQTVTVMFVDFVGFSKVAERMPSQLVFASLKRHFSDLGKIIHKHHGIVDKSLGDGLLGVFGFDPITKEVSTTHADDAVMAAIEIQQFIGRECAGYLESAEKSDKVIFASRVGLNTGSVFIGNIGEDGRLDLTVIGHAVNMGKRYEDSCEPFKILMGQNTKQYLSGKNREKVAQRDIKIKHHSELIHAYELDPFESSGELYTQAIKGFRDFSQVSRSSERLLVPPEQIWEMSHVSSKLGVVLDYSAGGLCVDLVNYLGNKVNVEFDLVIKSKTDSKVLHELKSLHAVVAWGRRFNGSFRHGLIFSGESQVKFSSMALETLTTL